MKEFNAERHYRDARITNIYERTTQLQYPSKELHLDNKRKASV